MIVNYTLLKKNMMKCPARCKFYFKASCGVSDNLDYWYDRYRFDYKNLDKCKLFEKK